MHLELGSSRQKMRKLQVVCEPSACHEQLQSQQQIGGGCDRVCLGAQFRFS